VSGATDLRPHVLFIPQVAYRARANTNTDTPIPPDEAAGTNPPDDAVNYMLGAPAGMVTLEILDAAGKLVRRYSTSDPVDLVERGDSTSDPVERTDLATARVPVYWHRPPHPGAVDRAQSGGADVESRACSAD
jgi:hypothetical protein